MSQTAPALADCLGAQLSAQGVKTPAGLSRALSELIAAVDAPGNQSVIAKLNIQFAP